MKLPVLSLPTLSLPTLSLPILSLSVLPLSALSVVAMPSAAQAVCVGVDVPTQVAIHGQNTQANQQSESHFDAEPGCFGSTTVHTGTQVYTGNGDIDQTQSNSHYLGGNSAPEAGPYVETDPLFFSVPTQVELDVLPADPSLGDYYGNDGTPNGMPNGAFDGSSNDFS